MTSPILISKTPQSSSITDSNGSVTKPKDTRLGNVWLKFAEQLLAKQNRSGKIDRTSFLQAVKEEFPRTLHWRQRSPEIRQCIDQTFDFINRSTGKIWYSNGVKSYNILTIKDDQLIERIIREAAESQKDFFFLDIGAGDFSWGMGLAKYLTTRTDLRKDAQFHIVSVSGENSGQNITKLENCIIYNLGSVKIEELEAELLRLKLPLKHKIDLAISRLCFTHLIDPIGTLPQAYNWLRPKTGLLLAQNFSYYLENSDVEQTSALPILEDLRAPYLIWRLEGGHEDYLVRKSDAAPARIPMRYISTYEMEATRYKRATLERDKREPRGENDEEFQGDPALYDWLKKFNLIDNGEKFPNHWAPVFKDNEAVASSSSSGV